MPSFNIDLPVSIPFHPQFRCSHVVLHSESTLLFCFSLPNLLVLHFSEILDPYPEIFVLNLPLTALRYRAGYSYKDSRQTNILALKLKHEHFRHILSRAAITSGHHGPLPASERKKPVRVQWDPERTPSLGVLPYRSIQIGIGSNDNARTRHQAKRRELRAQATHEENGQDREAEEGEEEEEGNESKELKRKWAEEWILEIQDVTDRARRLKELVEERRKEGKSLKMEEAVSMGLCPRERVYGVSEELRVILQMDVPGIDDGKEDGVKREKLGSEL